MLDTSVVVLQATQAVHDLVMIPQELEHIISHGFAASATTPWPCSPEPDSPSAV